MNTRTVRLLSGMIALVVACVMIFVGGVTGCGGSDESVSADELVTPTADLVLPDGTAKELTDAPLARSVIVRITFSSAVDPTQAEALFGFSANGAAVPGTITWNDDNTVMLFKPNNLLEYETVYTIAVDEGQVSPSESANLSKAGVIDTTYNATFTTMLENDINGDGLADLIVPARTWQGGMTAEGGTGAGRTYLFYGGDGIVSKNAAAADAIVSGEANDDQMWGFLSNDVNDDGYADLITISILHNTSTGSIYIFYGGAGDMPISGNIDAANADLILTGAANNDAFLFPYLGDVNGDGYTDITVPANGCSAGTGCVYVFFGPDFVSESAAGADVTITGEGAGDAFGMSTNVGDVNGDGIADILVGAPGYSGGANTGRTYVFYGSADLSNMGAGAADVIIDGEAGGDQLRYLTRGDVNGDGIWDVVSTAVGYDTNAGRVYVSYGGSLASGSAADADVILTGETGKTGFGGFVRLGDVNGDGVNDILVSSTTYDTNTGRVYGFYGGTDLASAGAADADFIFTGENTNNNLVCRFVGDVNGDGVGDAILSASGYPNGNNQGRVYAFFGSASIASASAANADVIITGIKNDDRLYSLSVTDINGDGIMDPFTAATGFDGGGSTGQGYLFYGGSSLASQSAGAASVIMSGENLLDRFGM